MRTYPMALVVLGLVGVGAMAGGAPLAPGPAAPPEPRAVGDTWTNSRGIKFAYIPAGEFLMGSPETEAGRREDEKQHQVKLTKPFLLGVYPVTQGQWKAVMGSSAALGSGTSMNTGGGMGGSGGTMGGSSSAMGGSSGRGSSTVGGSSPSFFTGDDNLPVEEVSWIDATNFCRRLGSSDGRTYRLPTEAEWEYACRAGTTSIFNCGDALVAGQANFDGRHPGGRAASGAFLKTTVAVGSYAANAWHLHDMHGNVWEWCADCHSNYPSGCATNPVGYGLYPVYRGGGWNDDGQECRSADRRFFLPEYRLDNLGLRIARDAR